VTVRDHTGISLSVFNGLWQRGDIDTVPIDHFSDCSNIDFVGDSSFRTRPGIAISQSVSTPIANIKRVYNYPTQTANTLIFLAVNEVTGVGSIYHQVNPSTIYGPILSILGMEDFAFVPYAGRGYISPFSSSQPALNSPQPLIAVIATGAGLGAGNYNYAVTFVNTFGETIPSALTSVITIGIVANPAVAPLIVDTGNAGPLSGNGLIQGATYKWAVTFTANGLETALGPASTGFIAPFSFTDSISMNASILTTLPVGATLNIYQTLANGSTYYLYPNGILGQFNIGATNYIQIGIFSDSVMSLQKVAPIASASVAQQQVQLNSIPIDSTGNATSRNIYRTAVNGTQLQLLHSLANNTTTSYLDTNADGTLGVDAPTINTAYTSDELIEKGMSGQFVYVYAGDGTNARQAAGAGIIGGTMTITPGAGGFMDLGQHIFGIVTQTISGYNSPPTVLTSYTSTASQSLSFGNIPTSGDPSVTTRLLVSTIAIPAGTYNGNLAGYQFFFVPGAVINNNTDTFLNNVSFYDADLLQDASALLQNYTSIPAGAVLSLYNNRLIVAATATDISLALLSQPGQPEAINQITGLIIIPLDGNPITNAQSFRGVLYMFKRTRTSAFTDNGQEPSTWTETIIDTALGTCVHGVATSLDSGQTSVDNLIIATFQGISLFNGKYTTPELTWKIANFWQQLDQQNFNLIQMVNEPITKKLYCVLPTRQLLVGDWNNGLDWKDIRWCPWTFNLSPSNPGISTVAVYDVNNIVLGADLV
jgi:hypothetical protein